MTEQAKAIIDYAYNDEGKEMRDAVYQAIQDKVMAHIDAQKQEVAQTLLKPMEDAINQVDNTVTDGN